jgi:hypothetical protein
MPGAHYTNQCSYSTSAVARAALSGSFRGLRLYVEIIPEKFRQNADKNANAILLLP